MPTLNQKGVIAQGLILLLLLGGIVVGVYLVQHQTNFLPKAQEENYIQIVDEDGNPVTQTDDPNVYLKITLPVGWELPAEKPASSLVKVVFAQECPVKSDCCYQPLQTCNQNNDCPAGYQWCYSGYCVNQNYDPNSDSCAASASPTPSSTPQPPRGASYKTCTLTANPNSGKVPLDVLFALAPVDDIFNRPADAKITINYGDGNVGELKDFDFIGNARHKYRTSGDFTIEFKAVSQLDPNYNYKCSTSVSVRPAVGSIDIQNNDEDQSSGGFDPLHIETNFGLYTTTLIPWRLNSLNADQNSALRTVGVTFWDQSRTSNKTATSSVTLNRLAETQTPAAGNEFLVDVFIDKEFPNQKEIAQWSKDTINNYINDRFAGAGITRRLRVNNIFMKNSYSENLANCPEGTKKKVYSDSTRCVSIDGKIRVWLFTEAGFSGQAFPDESRILMAIPSYPDIDNSIHSPLNKQTLAHEMGHIFNLPDYYWEDVDPNLNDVLDPDTDSRVRIGITSYIKDVMWSNLNYENFSLISPIYSNRIIKLPISTYLDQQRQPIQFVPIDISLKIVDSKNLPLENVKVEIFSQSWTGEAFAIANKVVLSDLTDQNGEMDLVRDGAYSIFTGNGFGYSAFLRVTKDNDVRYTSITRSYLNYLYYQGQREKAVITLPFDSLVRFKPGVIQILSRPGQPPITTPELSDKERLILNNHIKQELQDQGLISE